MRAVNLLPVQSSTRLPKSTVMPLAGAAAAVVAAGIVGTLAHAESGKVAKEQRQLDNLTTQLSKLPSAKATSGTETSLIASRASRYAAVEAALSGRVAWDTVLRQIALVLPSDTWLDGLQLSAPTTGDPTATATTSGRRSAETVWARFASRGRRLTARISLRSPVRGRWRRRATGRDRRLAACARG